MITGVFAWGLMAAVGLGAILTVSEIAYRLLQYAGAVLIAFGLRLALERPG